MTSPNKEYLQKRIELLEKEIIRQEAIEGRFGDASEWDNGTIFVVFTRAGYTYVIIKISNDTWYTTAQRPNVWGWKPVMTWAQLVDVMMAEGSEIYRTTEMAEV